MTYQVAFFRQAAKEIKRLDRTTAKRVQARIEELATEPFSPRISHQRETDPESRYSRVGDWRIIYRVNEVLGVLDIVAVRPRSSAYR